MELHRTTQSLKTSVIVLNLCCAQHSFTDFCLSSTPNPAVWARVNKRKLQFKEHTAKTPTLDLSGYAELPSISLVFSSSLLNIKALHLQSLLIKESPRLPSDL